MLCKKKFISLVIFMAGCSHFDEKHFPDFEVDEIAKNPDLAEGQDLTVYGFLKPMDGAYFLYKDAASSAGEDHSSGIDVVLGRGSIIDYSEVDDGKCAIVHGVFKAFDGDTMGIGYFRSGIGFVEAKEITLVDCQLGSLSSKHQEKYLIFGFQWTRTGVQSVGTRNEL